MSASLISFRLARAQRPHLHKDRNSNLHGTPYLLSYAPDRQLIDAANASLINGESLDAESFAFAGVTAQLQLVKDQYQLYLGETCVFYLTLSNQGSTAVTDITIKVEFVVEGGSSTVLYDSGPNPLPSLPVSARHDVIVNTDIKEQGAIQLVASAMFTDHSGERKYHVQFFKLTSSSPLSVRTRVRCLPHIHPHNSSSGGSCSGSSSSSDEQQAPLATRAFLEVSVENATQLPLVLHAVRLLPVVGIAAQQLSICEQQQQQQQVAGLGQQQNGKASSSNSSSMLNDTDCLGSDTQQLHDIADAPAGNKQQQQKALTNGFQQLQLQQQQLEHQQQDTVLGPLLQAQQSEPLVIVPPNGSRNYLWQVDHYLPSQQHVPTASGTMMPGSHTSSSSSSSNLLGRLELHWSNRDGKTGRLLTQPLSGPSTGWHRDVLLQLIQLQPLTAAAAAGAAAVSVSHQTAAAAVGSLVQPRVAPVAVGELFRATLSLTAAAPVGHLLVLHTELTPTGPPGSSNRDSSSGGALQQQQVATAGSSSSNSIQRRVPVSGPHSSSSSNSSSDKPHPDIAVQGPRTQRVQQLLPGQTAQVQFVLLPLRPGWVRLPTFVVMSEADGRLLDSVHDVCLLVE